MDEDKKIRKSLAVCKSENRSKIDQLREMIGNEHKRIQQRNAVEA